MSLSVKTLFSQWDSSSVLLWVMAFCGLVLRQPTSSEQLHLKIQEVCVHVLMCVQVCVCVRQCVTSRKLLSADLHYALFPLGEKQASFVRKGEGEVKQTAVQYGTEKSPVATIKVQKCWTKSSVITLLLPYARYHISNGKIPSHFDRYWSEYRVYYGVINIW